MLKTNAACLANTTYNTIIESTYFNNSLPGQLWNLDLQCSFLMSFNSSASRCQVNTQSSNKTRVSFKLNFNLKTAIRFMQSIMV